MYNIIFLLAFFLNISLLGMEKPSVSVSAAAGAGTALQAAPQSYDVKAQGEQAANDSGLFTTFKAVKDIHILAAAIAEAEKERGDNALELKICNWLATNPRRGRTKKGLFLRGKCPDSLNTLYTPWGEKTIYATIITPKEGENRLLEAFRKNMELALVKGIGGKYKNDFLYKVVAVNGMQLTEAELDDNDLTDKEINEICAISDQWSSLNQILPAVVLLPLPSMKRYFKLPAIPNLGQAWIRCETNADKVAVFEEALKVVSREKNKDIAKKQGDCLKALLKEQCFLDYIKQDLSKKIDEIIGA